MYLAYFHGEGILFSFLIHAFFMLLSSAALLVGLLMFKSKLGACAAIAYVGFIVVCVFISQQFTIPLLENIATLLTLPWSAVLPCHGLDSACSLSLVVAFICAELNAAGLYFLMAMSSRRRKSRDRRAQSNQGREPTWNQRGS